MKGWVKTYCSDMVSLADAITVAEELEYEMLGKEVYDLFFKL
ncbi:hypothetical protein FACS189472_14480 [Alphaproteobacteria bacterium]|nr:hypothetical protein FACS189472_14480 [Alphaproteobacteria bacterium]